MLNMVKSFTDKIIVNQIEYFTRKVGDGDNFGDQFWNLHENFT